MAKILLQEQGKLLQEVTIIGDTTRIGREQLNHVQLTDPRISRYHAEIHRRGCCYTLVDKKSTNGTRLNGTPLREPATLSGNDTITLGDYTLVFQLDAADTPETVHPSTFDASATIIDTVNGQSAD
jgi:pSer/pThr/pTyr-binding forkhead associated (FHA) protein